MFHAIIAASSYRQGSLRGCFKLRRRRLRRLRLRYRTIGRLSRRIVRRVSRRLPRKPDQGSSRGCSKRPLNRVHRRRQRPLNSLPRRDRNPASLHGCFKRPRVLLRRSHRPSRPRRENLRNSSRPRSRRRPRPRLILLIKIHLQKRLNRLPLRAAWVSLHVCSGPLS